MGKETTEHIHAVYLTSSRYDGEVFHLSLRWDAAVCDAVSTYMDGVELAYSQPPFIWHLSERQEGNRVVNRYQMAVLSIPCDATRLQDASSHLRIEFRCKHTQAPAKPLAIIPTMISPFSQIGGRCIRVGQQLLIYHDNYLEFVSYSILRTIKEELQLLKRAAKDHYLIKAAILRAGSFVLNFLGQLRYRLTKREWWVLYDRAVLTGDNAAHLFSYITKLPKEAKAPRSFFLLSAESDSYEEMKRVGRVLNLDSFAGMAIRFMAQREISSHFYSAPKKGSAGIRRGFEYVKTRLCPNKYMLQHGVMAYKVPYYSWYNQGFSAYMGSTYQDQKLLLSHDMGYELGAVPLVGQCRFDALGQEAPARVIALAPTWRKRLRTWDSTLTKLAPEEIPGEFINSNYVVQYKELLADSHLHNLLVENAYELHVYIHPNMAPAIEVFIDAEKLCVCQMKHIVIKQPPHDYSKLLNQAAILITDYSGIAFDFAYQQRPLLYFHFDRESFFAEQDFEESWFSFEDDGFGSVCQTRADLVGELEQILGRGTAYSTPELLPLYKERTKKTFVIKNMPLNS